MLVGTKEEKEDYDLSTKEKNKCSKQHCSGVEKAVEKQIAITYKPELEFMRKVGCNKDPNLNYKFGPFNQAKRYDYNIWHNLKDPLLNFKVLDASSPCSILENKLVNEPTFKYNTCNRKHCKKELDRWFCGMYCQRTRRKKYIF